MSRLWLCLRMKVYGKVWKKKFSPHGSEGRSWGGGGRCVCWQMCVLAPVCAGCLWSTPWVQWLALSKSQEKQHMPLSLVNHSSGNAGCRAHTEVGFVPLAAAGWQVQVQSRVLSPTALAAHTLLQAAEKSGSDQFPNKWHSAESVAQTCPGAVSLKVI